MISNRGGYGRKRPPAPAPSAGDEEGFRLVVIEPVRAPEGCVGRDWLVYRIAQGGNIITGYRQGELRAATAEVEKIVDTLNERRVSSKNRSGPKPKASTGTAAAASPPAPVDGDDS
jgi:hypothetical protein